MDVGLFLVENCIDLKLENGDFVLDESLETAVLISLFSNRRANESDLPAGISDKQGWWADEFADVEDDEIGSKLWTLARAKATAETIAKAEAFCNDALLWMIEDGVARTVSVLAEYDENQFLLLNITITRPTGENDRFSFLWDGQEAKRAA